MTPPVRSRPVRWARVAADRVPTKWFITAATGVFLLATAAFGGLADAETPATPSINAGETFSSSQLSMTVTDVVLLDSVDEFFIDLEPGQQAVAAIAEVTNEWTEPQLAAAESGAIRDVVSLELGGNEFGTEALLAIVRNDDPQTSPMLQPGVSVPLAFIWAVPAGLAGGGDTATVGFFSQSLHTGTVTAAGQWWTDPALAATMAVTVAVGAP